MALLVWAAATACSPACTPPEAKSPESSGKGKTKAPGGGGSRDALPMPDDSDMIKEAKGVSLGKLTEAQKTSFFQIINTEPSPCKKGESIAKSLRDDDKCRNSMVVSQFVADKLGEGASPSAIGPALDIVKDALTPVEIDIEGRPVYGEPNAPVTVVVFADFECGHCKREAPVLRSTIEQFRGRAKLVYKHYPLPFHKRAKIAAVAAEAAHDEGKFWKMHDLVFANQEKLSDADLEAYAQQLGLDMGKFKAAMADKDHVARVEKDQKDGSKLGISGTPTVYVNGRHMIEGLFGNSLAGWIDDALKR